MDSKPMEDKSAIDMQTSSSGQSPTKDSDIQMSSDSVVGSDKSTIDASTKLSGISTWAKNFRIPQSLAPQENVNNPGKSNFTRFTAGFSLRFSPKAHNPDDNIEHASTSQAGLIGTLTRGLVDSSKNAVKAMQVKARHAVSQNKRRYQEGGFDLDMTYITENIIAMGFPAGDMSSGFFGYVEGFYRNHMEEVIKFFETHHQNKYKVYNLCSERLYDASLFEGKVASFPFDDHNCPPVHLIILFCQSAYSWLKEDIENVVVVHCKAGMARTGLMISSLLLFLKFFPTAEESIDYYNQKRCFDGKGLVLPSQIRYVKYFERILTYFNGENLPGRRCMLRGIRLHRCPYWIRPSITVSNQNDLLFATKKHPRTKDLATEDFWFNAPKKGLVVFALPGEPGLTELAGDFKIHFHDKHGDFYFWLNTTMMENRKFLGTDDLDGFDKRKLPSPGFQVEIVLADCVKPTKPMKEAASATSDGGTPPLPPPAVHPPVPDTETAEGEGAEKDVFSDNEAAEEAWLRREGDELAVGVEKVSMESADTSSAVDPPDPTAVSEFKAMAADASVFTFGDEDDDYDSD